MQVMWLDLPSILWRRQRDFSITGSESEVEEAWLGSGAHGGGGGGRHTMRQEKYPGSLEGQFHPISPSHSRLQGSSCLPFYFIFSRILAAFLRYNEIQCAFDKSIQCLVLIVI